MNPPKYYLWQARRWALLALVPAVIVAALVYSYEKRQPKMYRAAVTLYVEQHNGGGISVGTDVLTSSYLVQTYSQMIPDPVIERAVDKQLASSYPGYRVEDHDLRSITSPQQNSQLLSIAVNDTLPARAVAAANASATAFIDRIRSIEASRFTADERTLQRQLSLAEKNLTRVTKQINSYRGDPAGLDSLRATLAAYQSNYQALASTTEQFRVARDTALNSVSVYSPATDASSIGPYPTRYTLLAGFIVLLLLSGAIYAYDYFADPLHDPKEVERIAGAPVLGVVQKFKTSRRSPALVTARQPRSMPSETYRLIRTNIQFTQAGHPPRSIVITSPSAREGKSTTAGNLARVFADGGEQVTVLDADLRRPSLHRIFSSDNQPGLTNLLVGTELNGLARRQTDQPNLALIASGPLAPNPADLLNSTRMEQVLEAIQDRSGIVIIDAPPILAVADAAILATMTDGVILVVDPHTSTRRALQRAREAVEAVNGKILGVVINRVARRGVGYSYYDYYDSTYSYAGKNGPRRRAERSEPQLSTPEEVARIESRTPREREGS